MIKILDYGMGNCGSIKNMLRYLGTESEIVNQIDSLLDATAIIVPGVGSFDHGMKHLEPFRKILEKKVFCLPQSQDLVGWKHFGIVVSVT